MKRLFEDRTRQFWILHTLGWLGFAVVNYLNSLVLETRDAYVIVVVLDAYIGWLITIPLRYAYQRIWHWQPWKLALTVLLLAVLVAALWTAVRNFNYWEIYRHGGRPDEWLKYIRDTPFAFYVMLSWSGLYFGIKYYQTLQLEKQKSLTATNKAHEAQLKMLRYQLNPHFLFNTLNNIYSHTRNSSPVASKMLMELSDMLRYILYEGNQQQVALSKELKMITDYIELEKLRYGNKLEVTIDLPTKANRYSIAPLLLLPFVENCFKHGASTMLEHPWVSLHISINNNLLHMKLLNGKIHEEKPHATGIGLKNVQERLRLLYPGKHELQIINEPDIFIVNLKAELELLPVSSTTVLANERTVAHA